MEITARKVWKLRADMRKPAVRKGEKLPDILGNFSNKDPGMGIIKYLWKLCCK